MGNKQPLFFHFKSTVMRSIFSLAIVGMFLASGAIRADVVLIENTSAGVNRNISSFEIGGINYTNAEIRINGMRLFFATNVLSVSGTFRDGNGNSVSNLSGNYIGQEGPVGSESNIFEFSFSGTSLNSRSEFYGAYGFSGGNLATSTTNATISNVTGINGVYYAEINGSYGSFTNFTRFEIIGVPEPGTFTLGTVAAIGGAGAWWRRRRAKGKHADNRMEASEQAN